MPPPMTSMFFGCARSSSAPVESTMRGSSGRNGKRHGLGARGDDRLLELHDLLRAVAQHDLDVMRIDEGADAGHDLDLAHLGHAAEAAGQLRDDLVLVRAQLREVDRGRRERHAEVGEVRGLVDDLRDVQQRLRRDAADVQADPAERLVALDEDRLQAEVRGAERGRVTAGSRAEDHHLAFDVRLAGELAGDRRGGRLRAALRGCRSRRRGLRGLRSRSGGRVGRRLRRVRGLRLGSRRLIARRARVRLRGRDDGSFVDLVAELDLQLDDLPAGRRRDLHRRLVALDRDQRLIGRDDVARLDQHLDDLDVLEVADVRNLELDHRGLTAACDACRRAPRTGT